MRRHVVLPIAMVGAVGPLDRHRHRDVVAPGELDQRRAGIELPLPPGSDDPKVRRQRRVGQLEAHLVVKDRDVLYFLSQSFRAQLVKELPPEKAALTEAHRGEAHRAKTLIKDLAGISLEMAQMVVAKQGEGEALPAWFLAEIVRDLPRLVEKGDGA